MRPKQTAHLFAGAACLLAAALVPASAALGVQATEDRRLAVLEALDKVTARVTRLTVPVGQSAVFRTLTITVRACRSTPASQRPDNAAFLEIDDHPPEAEPFRAFSGWMFSSSPSLSAMQHPVYDVWVQACADEEPRAPEAMTATEATGQGLPNNPPLPVPRPLR